MLELYNSFGKRMEPFHPVNPQIVNIFTCGPSVYQRSHIGNFRTFLFEDVLVRYLEYSGYAVRRGMNFTDIEEKALKEAHKKNRSLNELTSRNIETFVDEMHSLKMKIPDYLPRASEHVEYALRIIEKLLKLGTAYQYGDSIYFDPLKFSGFGKIYGLDMAKWPSKKVRFHRDTYRGKRWNRGDFILWHGCLADDRVCWNSAVGRGWPAWNIQDPSMVSRYFDESLSIYCGGIDNLIRHHDYSVAILESVRPYPMAKFWLHCQHLYSNGRKMSKGKDNVLYTDTLAARKYSLEEIRFFLIYSHYRKRMNYSDVQMHESSMRLKALRDRINRIREKAGTEDADPGEETAMRLLEVFSENMDRDLDIANAFNSIESMISNISVKILGASPAAAIMNSLAKIDSVFQVLLDK